MIRLPSLLLCFLIVVAPAHGLSMKSSSQSKTMISRLIRVVQTELTHRRDPAKALRMQGYLKTTMPMYGLQKPERAQVEKLMYEHIEITSMQDYQACIEALYALPSREEKYLAVDLALHYKNYIGMESLDLYESMIRQEYMWWDFCDPISINLIGKALSTTNNAATVRRKARLWINDTDSMWMRRVAILTQLKYKTETDAPLLFELCRARMHEKEFFIRKSIGWALREYSKTDADAVIDFLTQEKANLSTLSYREGAKVLVKKGKM